MLAKILRVLRWVIGGALLIIGVSCVVLLWWLSGAKDDIKKQPEKINEPLPIAAPVVESCECSTGAICTGPRGGKYCLTPSGNKKYTEKQP